MEVKQPARFRLLRLRWLVVLLTLGFPAALGWWLSGQETKRPSEATSAFHSRGAQRIGGMVEIPAGVLPLGSHHVTTPADRPLPTVKIQTFWMDATEVTNRQFAEFVAATGYVTLAEREGQSDVFNPRQASWSKVNGADWRHPLGPNSSIAGRESFPVVQVAWQDAAAYARWSGKRLPTEHEWEYAARGGLYDADYPWGREETPEGVFQANSWQGWFPDQDRAIDGFKDLAPVGSFLPNNYGLVDMAGNVWEWCADEYHGPNDEFDTTPANSLDRESSRGTGSGLQTERRLRRGGSWLCCENYSLGFKLSSRSSVPASARSNHLGFRCVSDQPTILSIETAQGEAEETKR